MRWSIVKVSLVYVFCIVSWTCVEADKKVTITGFDVEIPDNEVIDSWSSDLVDNLVGSKINVKKNCPGLIKADIKVYKDGQLVNQMHQKLEKPIKDCESYGICESIDSPELDDDSCSLAEGEQTAKGCDVRGWYSDMEPGDYRTECDLTQGDNVIASIRIEAKVENN